MLGSVIHIAIAQEYIKKHKNNKENEEEFLYGAIKPDLIQPKSKSHYGKSSAYTSLSGFLDKNILDNSINRGQFLHLITDYLFYNFYLDNFSKQYIYDDYDILNKELIEKYNVKLIKEIEEFASYKEGKTKILNMELACRIIDEISSMDIDKIKNEVLEGNKRWNYYKNIV